MAGLIPPPAPAPPWRRVLALLTDLLYPPRCGGCGRVGQWLCGECIGQIEPPLPAGWTCAACGAALDPGDWLCCPATPLAGILAIGAFAGPLREAIHTLKYRRQRALAPALAELLVAGLVLLPAPWGATRPAAVPVPLHPRRLRERGFSQSDLLAAPLAARLGYPRVAGLARVRATPSQVGLTGAARRANMAGAFAWRATPLACRPQVLLIDDVYTTGATMTEAARALHAGGAGAVYGLALARSQTI